MMRLMIVRSKGDDKAWLVDADGAIVSEIDNDALTGELACNADSAVGVEVRAHAASHAYHSV